MKDEINYMEASDYFFNEDGFVLEVCIDDIEFCDVTHKAEFIIIFDEQENNWELSSYQTIFSIVEKAIMAFPDIELNKLDFKGANEIEESHKIVLVRKQEELPHVKIFVEEKHFANIFESGELHIFSPGNREYSIHDGKIVLWWYFENCMRLLDTIERAVKMLEGA